MVSALGFLQSALLPPGDIYLQQADRAVIISGVARLVAHSHLPRVAFQKALCD